MRELQNFAPAVSGLGEAVRWLHDHNVRPRGIAAIFDINPNHARQLAFRACSRTYAFPHPAGSLDELLSQPIEALKQKAHVRPEADTVQLVAADRRRLAQLSDELEMTIQSFLASGDFRGGVHGLQALLPYFGYAGSTARIRILARIHQQLAWLYTHLGLSTSSFESARLSISLYLVAFRENRDAGDFKRLSQSCLIASNSCLLAHDPHAALAFIGLADHASARVEDRDLADHHRQRAVALFQLKQEEAARPLFASAADALTYSAEPQSAASIALTGKRHLSILGTGNWDWACDVLELVEREFPEGSLQRIMAVTSAAAAGLSLESKAINLAAMDLLESHRTAESKFGHQATRLKLLSYTLDLPDSIRRDWVKWALYANSFRER